MWVEYILMELIFLSEKDRVEKLFQTTNILSYLLPSELECPGFPLRNDSRSYVCPNLFVFQQLLLLPWSKCANNEFQFLCERQFSKISYYQNQSVHKRLRIYWMLIRLLENLCGDFGLSQTKMQRFHLKCLLAFFADPQIKILSRSDWAMLLDGNKYTHRLTALRSWRLTWQNSQQNFLSYNFAC